MVTVMLATVARALVTVSASVTVMLATVALATVVATVTVASNPVTPVFSSTVTPAVC